LIGDGLWTRIAVLIVLGGRLGTVSATRPAARSKGTMAKDKRATSVKSDRDLFDRLRRAGVRKQIAKSLSELGEGTSKKAVAAARAAVAELRSVADEIERWLPVEPAKPATPVTRTRRAATRVAPPARRAARTAKPAAASAASPGAARAPRGQNTAKILAALRSGPKTASQIASETGIGAGTVSSTLTKMASIGEVVKAARGYGLPS
jgi:predicted Rossmann fold nucleotide-binding protein DprA/Smf involved in DNA uptake